MFLFVRVFKFLVYFNAVKSMFEWNSVVLIYNYKLLPTDFIIWFWKIVHIIFDIERVRVCVCIWNDLCDVVLCVFSIYLIMFSFLLSFLVKINMRDWIWNCSLCFGLMNGICCECNYIYIRAEVIALSIFVPFTLLNSAHRIDNKWIEFCFQQIPQIENNLMQSNVNRVLFTQSQRVCCVNWVSLRKLILLTMY